MHIPLLSILILGFFGSSVGVLHAAYIIKLKNGNEYVTTRYWHAGSQVLFDTYGGTFGIERAFVTKIEKTDRIVRRASARKRQMGRAKTDATITDKDSVKAKPAKAAAEANTDQRRGAEDPIMSEFDRLKQKSNELNGMLTSEIRDLLREITAFKNKLSKDSKLFIEHGREFNDAHEIGSRVENVLRSRTQ